MADARLAKAKALLNADEDAPAVVDDVALAPTTDSPATPAPAPPAPPNGNTPEHQAAIDDFVKRYVDAPAVPATQPYGGGSGGASSVAPVAVDPTGSPSDGTGMQSSGANTTPSAPTDQVADANSEAAKRAEFNKLNAERSAGADARIAAQANPGTAVIVSKGGMRPESDTAQVTQGPEVQDAGRLLHNIEYESTRAAGDNATAEKARDTTIAGLEGNYAKGSNTLAVGEQKAQQAQSEALGTVADRMRKAIEAARVPVVSPAQDLNNMGIGQKLAFALAAAGGGIASRGTGGNAFLDGYNQMVDARIKTQEQQSKQNSDYAGAQENLYGVMRKGFESDDAARAGMRLMYNQAFKAKLDEAATHYNIDAANPNYMKMQAGIAQQILQDQMELAKIQGTHVSEQKTERYAPPQVAVIGGPPKGEAETRNAFDKYWTDHKLYDKKADLDTLDNIVRTADKGGAVMKYAASHSISPANAYFAMVNDPAQRQLVVDIQSQIRDNIQGAGMRSELGRSLGTAAGDPNNAFAEYNRLAHNYSDEASQGVAAHGGYPAYQRWQADAQDIRDTTNSLVNPQAAEPLPSSLPRAENPPPAPVHPIVAAYEGKTKKSHHKHLK